MSTNTSEFTTRALFISDRRSPGRFVWSHIRRHPLYAVLMLIGAFSNAALAGAMFYFIGQAFDALNAGAGSDAIVSATLAVNNVTNQKYWANLDYGNYADPRNVSVTLRAAF